MNWELERARHYRLIEGDPIYGFHERLTTMEAENAPSNCRLYGTPIPPTSFEIPLPCTECPTHKQFLGLRGELEHLKNKVTEMRARKRHNEAMPFK